MSLLSPIIGLSKVFNQDLFIPSLYITVARNVAQAEVDTLLQILQKHDDGLRLYEVAKLLKLLKLPHDHNYWQTYAILEWCIRQDLVFFHRQRILKVDGTLSKQKYRFFYAVQSSQSQSIAETIKYGWDRVIGQFKAKVLNPVFG